VGAGRKRLAAGLRRTPHRSRPAHRAAHPVHVTLRACLRSLRSQFVAPTVLGALRAAYRADFRVVHHSIQANHLHLIVEARTKAALSSGMRGLAVRLARRINRLLFRRGQLWVERWHGSELKSPRQVRNALVYVLQNHLKHARRAVPAVVDPLSSEPISTASRHGTLAVRGPGRRWHRKAGCCVWVGNATGSFAATKCRVASSGELRLKPAAQCPLKPAAQCPLKPAARRSSRAHAHAHAHHTASPI